MKRDNKKYCRFSALVKTIVLASVVWMSITSLFASEVTDAEAQDAVRGWAVLCEALTGWEQFKETEISGVETYTGRDGKGTFHVVSFIGGGYVVTSGDTEVTPILAYSQEGTFEASDTNPLWTLLTYDIAGRAQCLKESAMPKGTVATGVVKGRRSLLTTSNVMCGTYEPQWSRLRDAAKAASESKSRVKLMVTAPQRQSAISDLRVGPLCETRWSQGNAQNVACYNYYTPNNYPCGCGATAFAQLMCCFKWPQSRVSIGTHWYKGSVTTQNSISDDWCMGVDPNTGTEYPNLPSVFSGPAFGGPYDWDNMPANPEDGPLSDVMCQAIGLLTRDCGISLRMEYAATESVSYIDLIKLRLMDQFGYANAALRNYGAISISEQKNAMLASFDLGSPCAVGISGHAFIADGYGYSDGRVYIHFNYGWGASASETAWYTPPEANETNSDYPGIKNIIYNIYTPEKCTDAERTIVSGRVLNEEGEPLKGQIVTATDETSNEIFTATTGTNGIYALLLPAPATYVIIAENNGRKASTVRDVKKCKSDGVSDDGSRISSGGVIGNLHGVTLMLKGGDTSVIGQTWYVDAASGDDCNHGLNAANAFASIQKAIDCAGRGDKIIVNDGVYDAISSDNQLLTIESVNGAERTIIDGGYPSKEVRVADLANGSSNEILTNTVLRGFTVQNGYAAYGGGGTTFGTIDHCIVSNNTAKYGGGSWGGHRVDCVFVKNTGEFGGGMAYGTMDRCTVADNSATLGGGVYYVTGNNSVIRNNNATGGGGGAYYGSLNHCTFYGNTAESGGGMYGGTVINSIFQDNTAEAGVDTYRSDISYSCARNVEYNQGNGAGNIAINPCFVAVIDGDFHLALDSPCINAGRLERFMDVNELDMEGNCRIRDGRTDMGAYEADNPEISSVIVTPAVGGGVIPQATTMDVGGNVTVNAFGPRPFIGFFTNGVLVAETRSYTFENVTNDIVLSVEFDLTGPAINIYADAGESNDLADGTSPENAMRLQAAIDVALAGDTIVVADGVYTPIITENKAITIRSANGAGTTIIDGGGTNRCATLGVEQDDRQTKLVGFTLRNGYTAEYGGGALHGSLENCVLTGNKAYGGGGAERAHLRNCIVATNTASYGGGVEFADLEGCSLIGNVATLTWGGGARCGTLVDCLLEDNSCAADGGGSESATAKRCVYRNNSAVNGGGAFGGFLENCLVVGNAASSNGGGCYGDYHVGAITLVNCTVVGNSAGSSGGGIYSLTTQNSQPYNLEYPMCICASVNNSIVWRNVLTSGQESNYRSNYSNDHGFRFQYCCTSPLPQGVGNISSEPLLKDEQAGDFQLSSDSPCVNAGAESYAEPITHRTEDPRTHMESYVSYVSTGSISAVSDILGNPRVAFGHIDIGAYECPEVSIERIDSADIWGSWSTDGTQPYTVPESVATWDELSRVLWQARDAYVKSGSRTEVPPSEGAIVLSLGAMAVPDSLMTSEPPIETEVELGVSVWRLRVYEDTSTCSLIAVAGKTLFELSAVPTYLVNTWVNAVYGNPPAWLDASEANAWYAARARSRIEWFVTLVPQSRWATYCSNRVSEAAGTRAEGGENSLTITGFRPDSATAIHNVSVRSSDSGETRLWSKDSLSSTNWTYNGYSLQAPGTTAAGVHSSSNHLFVTATFEAATLDSDGDGIPDVMEEKVYGTNPDRADSSGDGISDWDKVYRYGLNPNVRDTSGDGIDDDERISAGADPRAQATPEQKSAAARSIRYQYDGDDRLTGTFFGLGGAAVKTKLSPAGNPTEIRNRNAAK